MYLLHSTYIGNEEEAVIKAIANSPGNFKISNIWPIIYIVLIFILGLTLEINIGSDKLVLFF